MDDNQIEMTAEEIEALELKKKEEMEFAGTDAEVSEEEATTDETVGESAEDII